MKNTDIVEYGRKVIDIECLNLKNLRQSLGKDFAQAVKLIEGCNGKVIITGIGKSGIIGRKICATFSSIGIPSMFLHPGEAIHGDLGMVTGQDIVIAISNSGETEEILRILPAINRIGAKIISLTSSGSTSLGARSSITISTGEIKEADAFGIIPSSSATCALVLGDALALTLMALKGVQEQDFAFFHPGGNLGKRLMLKVADVMQTGSKIPMVHSSVTLKDAIREIDAKNIGFTLVTDPEGRLEGIITDGDIRRLLAAKTDIKDSEISECITLHPKIIDEEMLAVQALMIMEKSEITCLVIVDPQNRPKGIVHLHDLLGKKDFRMEY